MSSRSPPQWADFSPRQSLPLTTRASLRGGLSFTCTVSLSDGIITNDDVPRSVWQVWNCLQQTQPLPSWPVQSGWKAASWTECGRVAEFRDERNAGRCGSPSQSISPVLEILGEILEEVCFTET